MWEIFSVLVAVLSLVPIISILAVYDSSSLPDWPSVITVGHSSFYSSTPSFKLKNHPDQLRHLFLCSYKQVVHYSSCGRLHLPV